MKKRLALDLHGILNTAPEFFAIITQSLVKDGWEIHVLTGSHLKELKVEEDLKKYGIGYTHVFSIADHHRNNKTPGMWYDEKGDPWVSDEDWDKTKAIYCKEHEIAFCIDDTARYAKYFETPFGYMAIQMNKEKPNRYLEYVIDMFKKRSQKSNWKRFEGWFNQHCAYYFSPPHKQGKERKNSIYK